ncbi:hypothetical protein NB595_20600 [Vibrio alginolyticus]|nr:hypothetical protein [Vibrio alginolyticus]
MSKDRSLDGEKRSLCGTALKVRKPLDMRALFFSQQGRNFVIQADVYN